MRQLHRWLGLVVGVQALVWIASGLGMSLLDAAAVSGETEVAFDPDMQVLSADVQMIEASAMLARIAGGAPVQALELKRELGFWVWRAETAAGVALYDARTGDRIEVTAEQARRLAEERYFGEGSVRTTTLVREATLEARGHPLPLWRVDFADARHTRYYVSPREGRILERRTDTWALFDVLWMLHTMDYSGRDDFNTPWVIAFAVGALWLAISGAFLVVKSFDKRSRT